MAESESLGELSVKLTAVDQAFRASMKEVSASLDRVAIGMKDIPTDKMTKNFISARTAVKDLNVGLHSGKEAFDLFTGKADLSVASLSSFTHLIPAMSSPLGAAITGVSFLAGALFELVKASDELDKQDIAEQFSHISDGLDAAQGGWREYYALLKQGVTDKTELKLAKEAGEASSKFDEAAARVAVDRKKRMDELASAFDDLKRVQGKVSAAQDGNPFGPIPPGYSEELAAAQSKVDSLQTKIDQLDGSLVQEAKAVGDATNALKEYKKALKEAGDTPPIPFPLGPTPASSGSGAAGMGITGFSFVDLSPHEPAPGHGPGGAFTSLGASTYGNNPLASLAPGGIAGSIAQGYATAGPLGALTGLLSQSKGFGQIMEKLNTVLQPIADGLGKVFTPLLPVIGMVGLVMRTELLPVFQVLGLEAKLVAWVFGQIFDVVKVVMVGLLKAVQHFAHALHIHVSGLSAALAAWENATYANIGAVNDATNATSNIPEGFKQAMYEFQAMTGTGGGGGSHGSTAGGLGTLQTPAGATLESVGAGGMLVHIDNVTVGNPEEFVKKLKEIQQRENYRMTGSTQPVLSPFISRR